MYHSYYPGNRYALSKDNDDVVLIYDVNGIIAGLQTIIAVDTTYNSVVDFEASLYYNKGYFYGEEVPFFPTFEKH